MIPFSAIEPFDRNLQCPLCLDALDNPLQLQPCTHLFCRGCFTQAVHVVRRSDSSLPSCPVCRSAVSGFTPPHMVLRNMCDEVDVRCNHCPWSGTRQLSRNHLCPSRPTPIPPTRALCPFPGVHPEGFSLTTSLQPSALIAGSVVEFSPHHDRSLRVDVYYGRSGNGARLWMHGANGTDAQRFRVIHNSNGSWSFEPLCAPGFVLDDSGAPQHASHLWERMPGNVNQEFYVDPAPGGGYYVRCGRNRQHVLDVDGSGGAESALLNWSFHGGPNQIFHIDAVVTPEIWCGTQTQPAPSVVRSCFVNAPILVFRASRGNTRPASFGEVQPARPSRGCDV